LMFCLGGICEVPPYRPFEPEVLEAFLDWVAPFPLGLLVELSDGRKGEVVGVDQHQLHRPRIRVTIGKGGLPLSDPYELDLAEERTLEILRPVPDPAGEWVEDVRH
jgi:hypothetical protein